MKLLRLIKDHSLKHPFRLIVLIFFLTRITNLTLLPIYADEANYLDWGWRSLHLKNFLFYSLYDAKQPLLIWLFGLAEILLPDPLFAGRLVSIFFGLFGLLGIYRLSGYHFNREVAIVASYLYIITPLFLFFDRQALMETSIAAIGIWSFYFLVKLLDKPNLKLALIFGALIASGIWIKNSALLFVAASGVIILFQFLTQPHHRTLKLTYLFLAFTFCLVLLSPLFIQEKFWQTFNLNSRYSLGFSELLKFPWTHWRKNFLGILDISFFFLTPLVFITALIGAVKNFPKQINLLLWSIIPLLQVTLTTRTLNFRYPASFLIPLIIFSASWIYKRLSLTLIVFFIPLVLSFLLLFFPPLYFDTLSRFSRYSYITDYVTGPLSGYLVNDLVSHLQENYSDQKTFVTFAVNSGNFEAALIDYFHKHPILKTSYLDTRILPEEITQYDCLLSSDRLLFIAREHQTVGLEKFLIEKTRIIPEHGSDFATIYSFKNTGCLNPITINPVIQ